MALPYPSRTTCPRCHATVDVGRREEACRIARCANCTAYLEIAAGPYREFRATLDHAGSPHDRLLTDEEAIAFEAARDAAGQEARQARCREVEEAFRQRVAQRLADGECAPPDRHYGLREFVEAYLDHRPYPDDDEGTVWEGEHLYEVLSEHFGVRLTALPPELTTGIRRRAHAKALYQALKQYRRTPYPFPGLMEGLPCPDCLPAFDGYLATKRYLLDLAVHAVTYLAGDAPGITSSALRAEYAFDDTAPETYIPLRYHEEVARRTN